MKPRIQISTTWVFSQETGVEPVEMAHMDGVRKLIKALEAEEAASLALLRDVQNVSAECNLEMRKLEAENKSLKSEMEQVKADFDSAAKRISELRKDAERYRWTSIEGNWVARMFGKWRAHVGEYGDEQPTDWYSSREEAIDAAMSKERPHG